MKSNLEKIYRPFIFLTLKNELRLDALKLIGCCDFIKNRINI